MIKLTKLREKLQIPPKFQNQFYFKVGAKEIENESKFVAWDVIQKEKLANMDYPEDD